MYDYKIKEVTKIVDGDTIDCILDLGFNISFKGRFRLSGYDAPETWRPKTEAERVAGEKVTQFLESLLEKYEGNIVIRSNKLRIYGRYDGVLLTTDNISDDVININVEVENFISTHNLTKEEVRKV